MPRTIRRKGFNKRTSASRFAQYNNKFHYLCFDSYRWMIMRGDTLESRLICRQQDADKVAKEVHRDSSYTEERWYRYVSPVPRLFHKQALKKSLRDDSDYEWDESGARKIEKGICIILWE